MTKLLFIYNANSGKINGYLDALHKVVSPKTYACNLCDITYGVFTENKAWKIFRTSSNIPMEFLHLDEFKKQYASKFGSKFTFPIVLLKNKGELELFISTEELNGLKNANELIDLIREREKLVF
ncbi:MAG: GTPase [Flavobacteriaceae bacterium]|nr:GTPase [Flavobacteriaceae bacterium]